MSSVVISRLCKSFRNTAAPAVDDVTFEVPSGQLVSLLGPSGCGKTTMLRLITGFLEPDAGTITVNGEDITRTPPHRRDIGMVYQDYALWPHMTVGSNVSFGLEMRGVKRAERRDRVHQTLQQVGLEEYINRYPTQLSGGQQQRVALARALAVEPKLLLLDEPLSNLDASLRRRLRDEIRDLQQRLGLTTLFVTHDQEEALAVSDVVILMRDGSITQAGSGESLYRTPESDFAMAFMGETNFFDGVVASRRAGKVLVQCDIGTMHLPADAIADDAGAPVSLGIRPADVEISRTGTGVGGNDDLVALGDVRRTTFLGPWVHYDVHARTGRSFSVQVPTGAADRIEEGEQVHLVLKADCVRVLRNGSSANARPQREGTR
jgi:putative spermidine/putrescine transport system ATP-binding protein